MFSGAVKIAPDALNDFIAPSQDCVVALDGGKLKLDDDGAVGASSEDAFSTGEVALRRRKPREDDAMAVDAEPTSTFTPTMTQGDALKVSLSDCLACSGCGRVIEPK